jgi:phage terminase large subunit
VAGRVITIPYLPRALQRELHGLVRAHRWSALVCHRRFGKTVWAVNHLQRSAIENTRERPRYAYIAPTYRQGKAVAWDYIRHYAGPIPSHEVNESELRIDYPNGGQVRIYGADNADSLRGLYFDGVIFDEFGLQSPTIFSEVVRPALAERKGYAVFMGTPAGKNQFYDIVQTAQREPGWLYRVYKASETGILPAEELQAARTTMTDDEYEQEFECSFEASVKGSIFGEDISQAREQGRVTRVPYDPMLKVDTAWDLGIGDSTAIWFCQAVPGSGEVRLIDYYEHAGEGLQHYANVLQNRGYVYGTHWAPHDIAVKELTSGRSRVEAAASLGLHFRIVPQTAMEDGIHAARMLLPRCWFDAVKTEHGLETLIHYRRDYNTRINEFIARPVHDWASHGADAFRYLALSLRTPKITDVERERQRSMSMAQRDHDPYDQLRARRMSGAQRRGGL